MELAGFLVGMLRTSGPSPAPLSSRTCPVLSRQQVAKAGALQTIIGTIKQKINEDAERRRNGAVTVGVGSQCKIQAGPQQGGRTS